MTEFAFAKCNMCQSTFQILEQSDFYRSLFNKNAIGLTVYITRDMCPSCTCTNTTCNLQGEEKCKYECMKADQQNLKKL